MPDNRFDNRTTSHTCSEPVVEDGHMPKHILSVLTTTESTERPFTATTCTKPPVGIRNPVTAYIKPRMTARINATQGKISEINPPQSRQLTNDGKNEDRPPRQGVDADVRHTNR